MNQSKHDKCTVIPFVQFLFVCRKFCANEVNLYLFFFQICDSHYFCVFIFAIKNNNENSRKKTQKKVMTKNRTLLKNENWWWLTLALFRN